MFAAFKNTDFFFLRGKSMFLFDKGCLRLPENIFWGVS